MEVQKIIKFMDNVGDWLYIVFLIIAAVSGLFSSKRQKEEESPRYNWGNPTGKSCLMTSLQKEKASGRYWRICKRKRKNLSPLPDKSR